MSVDKIPPDTLGNFWDTDASNQLTINWNEDDSADRNLNIKIHGADRSLDIEDDSIINQDLTSDASPTFANIKIADAGNIGSASDTDAIAISADGIITMNAQPAVRANVNTSQTNVTGDNTAYNITGPFWTEITDQNADFSNGTFTAPVTGTYIFSGNLRVEQLNDNHTNVLMYLITSNKSYAVFYMVYTVAAGDNIIFGWACHADMDAADTAYLRVTVYGIDKVVDVTDATYFGASLVC